MTLARLLARLGELSRVGLVCAACDREPERKRQLGCMETPRATRKGVEYEFTPEKRAKEGRDRYGVDFLIDRAWMTWPVGAGGYPWAALGDIDDHLGQWWDCCPRSYAIFSEPVVQRQADTLIDMALDRDLGLPAEWSTGGHSPTSGAVDLVRMVLRARKRWEHQRMQEDLNGD